MKKGFLSDAHPSRQLIFTVLIIIGSWIVFQMIGMISGKFVFGLTFNEIINSMDSLSDPRIIGFLKYVQAFTSTGMFIFAAIVSAWFITEDWKLFLGLKVKPDLIATVSGVFLILIILPFINLLTFYNSNLVLPDFLSGLEKLFRGKENQMMEIMEGFLKPGGAGGLAFNLLVIAIIPALGEELIFRGIIQKVFIRWFHNPHLAIFAVAFLFSAMHIQFFSFVPRFFLGLVLGYIFYWSGSIWITILVHFINNALATIFYFYFYGGYIGNYMEKAGTPEMGLALAFIGGISGSVLMYVIYRRYSDKSVTNSSEG